MEILILVLLYYLSQNPNFAASVQPLMSKIKDSEQMLNFLKDLSKFSDAFGGFSGGANKPEGNPSPTNESSSATKKSASEPCKEDNFSATQEKASAEDKKSPQSPTAGIADEFIQNILESYLKKS